VTTQELLELVLHCSRGKKPDVAIFYDGVNDVYSALQRGRSDGSPQNRAFWDSYFDTGVDPKRRWHSKLACVRLSQSALRRMGLISGEPRFLAEAYADSLRVELARQIASTYAGNVAMIQDIGRLYGFDTLFFWQPITGHQPEYEAPQSDSLFSDLFERTRQAAISMNQDLIDLSTCLGRSLPDANFIDHVHLNEDGNAVVARAMFDHLHPLIRRRLQEPSE
jgi:lysophospholipase L1-like esterase